MRIVQLSGEEVADFKRHFPNYKEARKPDAPKLTEEEISERRRSPGAVVLPDCRVLDGGSWWYANNGGGRWKPEWTSRRRVRSGENAAIMFEEWKND